MPDMTISSSEELSRSTAFLLNSSPEEQKKEAEENGKVLGLLSKARSIASALISDLLDAQSGASPDLSKVADGLDALKRTVAQLQKETDPQPSDDPRSGIISYFEMMANVMGLIFSISNKLTPGTGKFAAFASVQASNASIKMADDLKAIVAKIDRITGGPDGHVDSDKAYDVQKYQNEYSATQTADQGIVTILSGVQQTQTQSVQNLTTDASQQSTLLGGIQNSAAEAYRAANGR